MKEKLKEALSDIASFIQSLPPALKYPLIATLAVGLPAVTAVLAVAGFSVTVALSPFIIVVLALWFLS